MNNNSFMDTNQDFDDIDSIFDNLKDTNNSHGYFNNQYDGDGDDLSQILCIGINFLYYEY